MKDVKRILVVVLALALGCPSAAFAANNWWKGLAGDGLWSNDGNWQNAGGAPTSDAFLDQGLEPDSDLPTSVVLGGGGTSPGNIIIDGDNSLNGVFLGPKWDWQLPYSAAVTVPAGDSLNLTGAFNMGTWNIRLEEINPGEFVEILAGSNMVANLDGTVVADSFSYNEEGGNWVNIGGSVTVNQVVDDPNIDTWATVGNGLAMTGGTLTVTGNLENFFDDLFASGFLVATNGDYDAFFDGVVTTVTGSGEGFGMAPAVLVIPGDYNGNGTVGAADYTVWRDSLGQNITLPNSDPNDIDGVVTQAEYDFWKANFGNTVNGPGAGAFGTAAVPEPTSLSIVLGAILAIWAVRRR